MSVWVVGVAAPATFIYSLDPITGASQGGLVAVTVGWTAHQRVEPCQQLGVMSSGPVFLFLSFVQLGRGASIAASPAHIVHTEPVTVRLNSALVVYQNRFLPPWPAHTRKLIQHVCAIALSCNCSPQIGAVCGVTGCLG